jgi:hypothetical protein
MLAVVLMIMGLLTAFISLLATSAAQSYRDRQVERVRIVAQQLADSAAAFARLHAAEWKTLPVQPIELDVKALVPARLQGAAVASFSQNHGQPSCHITARASWGAFEVVRERDFAVPPTSQPAPQ